MNGLIEDYTEELSVMKCEYNGQFCDPNCVSFVPFAPFSDESSLSRALFDEEGIAGYIHYDK